MDQFTNDVLNELDRINLSSLNITIDKSNSEVYERFTDKFVVEYDKNEKNFIAFKHSIKIANITFKIKEAALFISENALALGMSYDSLSPWKYVILIVCNLINFTANSIIKLDDDMISIVEFLDNENAYDGIEMQRVYDKFNGSTLNVDETLQKLVKIKTILVEGDKITLKEKVRFKKKKRIR